jgi:hypothetical protein
MFTTIKWLITTIFILTTVNFAFSQGNDCSSATNLPVNASCTNQSFSNNQNGAAYDVVASCATAGTPYSDIWYTVTGTGNDVTITVSGTDRPYSLAAFTDCAFGTELDCTQQNTGVTGSITFPTTNGTTYYVQVQRFGNASANNNNQSGNICAVSAPPAPSNDDPCSATPLAVNTSCSFATYTNENATASAGVPAPGCASYSGGDVWFTVTVPASGNIELDMNTGVITDAGMAVYSGTCGSLTLIECDDDDSPNGAMSYISLTGQTPGATLWIRVWEYGNNNNGTFDICAYAPIPGVCGDLTVSSTTFSQNGLTTCGFGDDYSSADACGSSYMNGDDFVIEYTPTTSECVSINLSNTDTWTGVFLTDGCPGDAGTTCLTSATSSGGNPSISSYNVTAGTTYYITVSTFPSPQCTPFDIDIVACPPPPANDECSGAIPVTVNPDLNCGSTTSGTVQNATPSVQNTGSCAGTEDDDVWFSFVATNTTHTIDLLNVAGSTTDMYHSVWEGTCPTLTLVGGTCSDTDNQTVTGLTPGNTYYIRVYTWTSTGGQNSTFDLCVGTIPPPGPCTGDMTINSTLYSNTGLTTCGFGDDYSSTDACGSSYMGGDDIVIEYTPTTTQCVQIALSNTDTWVGLFVTDGCPDDPGTSCLASATNSSGNPTLNGLNVVAGTTYFITVSTFPSPQCTPFDIDITACPPPPANDECAGATNVGVTPQGGTCTPTTGTIATATGSSQTNDCFGTADDDVWYSFTATSTDVQIDLSNISGSTTDMYFSVYGGSCGSPGAALLCSDPNSGQVSGLTIGNTYFIRIYTYTSTGGQNVNFDLCVSEIGPCGITSTTEDYCPYPATLTQGPGSWSSSTYPYYSADTPGNSGTLFCGSVENNSWYQFTALNTTETFDFTSVTNCVWGDGIQAEVYEVTYDGSGCCSSFTSMSNCMNPGVATTATVTANGLTVGNTYILMVDGWGGDNCDFTVSGWTAQNIQLPVELTNLSAMAADRENRIFWTTITELDNDYFELERSFDGVNFDAIGTIDGAGNSNEVINYSFVDEDVRAGVVYYRLKQVDFDGESVYSETLSLDRTAIGSGIIGVYPNPAHDKLNVQLSDKGIGANAILVLSNAQGQEVQKLSIDNTTQLQTLQIDISDLVGGVYILQLFDQEGMISMERIIKD